MRRAFAPVARVLLKVRPMSPDANAVTPSSPMRRLAQVGYAAWLPVTVVPFAYLMAGHVAGLPTPEAGPALARRVAASRTEEEEGTWLVLHALYGGCDCSARILETLITRPPRDAVRERILFVAGDSAEEDTLAVARAEAATYPVERLSAAELTSRYTIEAAPLFVVAAPDGTIRYVGGYTERKRGPVVRDREIVTALLRGDDVTPLPVLGCAVDEHLRAVTDPLGLR